MWSMIDEDVKLIEIIASKIILADTGDYNISIQLPFTGGIEEIMGWRGYLQPNYIGLINSEINKKGNIKGLVKEEKEKQEEGDYFSFIPRVARELRRHPVIMGFYCGLNHGSTVKYENSRISYEDIAVNKKGMDFNEKFSRDVPVEKVETAISCGAVFGYMDTKELVKAEERFLKCMFEAKPHSLKDECDILYDSAVKDIEDPISPNMQHMRKEIFAKAVFNTILEDRVNLMNMPYLR